MLLALDDTDGPAGGCTTYVAARILDELGDRAVRGRPHLVRLHPDNPWKTRGNAALVLPLASRLDPEAVLSRAADVVDEHARLAEGKGAGLAVFEQAPDPAWYRRGVRERVGLDEARACLAEVPTWTAGSGRGLVGCLCAAAWRPELTCTFTRIAYREPDRRGTPRSIDEQAARRIQRSHETVFDAYDEANDHALLAPRTPCPVLVGLRATRPDRLQPLVEDVVGEPVERARTFVTNQASDDHLTRPALDPLEAVAAPERLEGGHVRLATRTPRGRSRDVLAFEPTGRLREGLLAVEPGDRLLALGSLKDGGGQVNAEKILHLPEEHTTPPACPGCGGSMASAGRRAGYRCPRCGAREPGQRDRRAPTWHEADASARRHLARPLGLGLAPRVQEAVRRGVEPVQSDPVPRGLAEN